MSRSLISSLSSNLPNLLKSSNGIPGTKLSAGSFGQVGELLLPQAFDYVKSKLTLSP